MKSVWSVSKCRPNPSAVDANCVHTADADATKQFRLVGVGGVYWALEGKVALLRKLHSKFLPHCL